MRGAPLLRVIMDMNNSLFGPSQFEASYCKPLVMAVLSRFSLGMVFPDLGRSV